MLQNGAMGCSEVPALSCSQLEADTRIIWHSQQIAKGRTKINVIVRADRPIIDETSIAEQLGPNIFGLT